MTNPILMASSLTRNATGLIVVLVLLFGISATILTAQTYTDLHDFNCGKRDVIRIFQHSLRKAETVVCTEQCHKVEPSILARSLRY